MLSPWSTLTHKNLHLFIANHLTPLILPLSTCHYCSSALSFKLAPSRHEETPQKAPPSINHPTLLMSHPPNPPSNHETTDIPEYKPTPNPTQPPSLQVSPSQSSPSSTSANPSSFSPPVLLPQLNSKPTFPQSSVPLPALNPKPPSPPPPAPTPTEPRAKTKAEQEEEVRETMAKLRGDQSSPPHQRGRKVVKVLSTDRLFRIKEFEARMHALQFLLSSSHFVTLLRSASTTPAQAKQLLAVAQEFGFVDSALLYALLKFYVRCADVPEAMRVVALLRAHGVPYSERERLMVMRTQRRARFFTEGTLRGEVIRIWAQLGDADMCMQCYEAMRAAGTHPGELGFAALLRVFRERGEDATCARLLADMGSVGFDRFVFPRNSADAADTQALGLESFKSLLRYHAELAEENVCARVLEEMRKRGVEEDEEVRSIVASMHAEAREEADRPQPTQRPKQFSKHPRTSPPRIYNHPKTNELIHQQSNIPNPSPSNDNPIPSPPTSTSPPLSTPPPSPQPTPTSTYKTELARWATMKEEGQVPTSEYIHSLLCAASREGDCVTCEDLLAAMDTHGIAYTAEAYACVMEACKADFARCEELFAAMRAKEIRPTAHAYNTMLWIICAQRRTAEAFALFEEMKDVADTISYNTLMRVYAGDGNLQSVMMLSAQMKQRSIAHDAATYMIMVELLAKFGVKGMLVVDAVVREIEKGELGPDVALYDTLMDVYGGGGRWEGCERVWRGMKEKGVVLGEVSCMRFLQKHCYKDPSIYVKWKKEFSNFLPP